MAESQQTFTFRVPLSLDQQAREIIGNRVVEFIRDRTDRGLDKNNKPFKSYSTGYVNSLDFKIAGKSAGDVDLQLSGDMLTDLEVLRTGTTGFITIGYQEGTEENDKAAWQRNNTRPSFPKRDFLGITQKDLDKIVNRYMAENPIVSDNDRRVEKEAKSILNRLFGGFNG